jgi:hypothetical protein
MSCGECCGCAPAKAKLRAAVLALAARLFNFRHWEETWRVDPGLL